MVLEPPPGALRITPLMYYEDLPGALEWLTTALGFSERPERRVTEPDGRILHAEVEYGGGVVALQRPAPGFQCARRNGGAKGLLFVYVTGDVDAHYRRAQEAGATVIEELSDAFYGDRRYGIEDPEGNQWVFGQHVRDVSLADVHKG